MFLYIKKPHVIQKIHSGLFRWFLDDLTEESNVSLTGIKLSLGNGFGFR